MKFFLKVSASIPPKIAEMNNLPRIGDIIFEKYLVISIKPPATWGPARNLPVVTGVLKQRLNQGG